MHITTLPYMGKHKDTPRKPIQARDIPFSDLREHELEQIEAALERATDPYVILTKKVTHLSRMLGCSEAEAERVILERIGC